MYDNPQEYDKTIEPKVDSTLGYVYFIDKDHPLSSTIGRVWMHRHIMSVKIGRWLSRIEVVHHEDEDRSNNNIENLKIFQNAAEHTKHHQKELLPIKCKQCCELFKPDNKGRMYCSVKCYSKSQRRTDITKTKLQKLVWEMTLVNIAAKFGISDKAVGKWCDKWGIQKPPHGYWIKSARSLIG